MIILCAGARDWTNRAVIKATLQSLGDGQHMVIANDEPGAAALSLDIADELRFRLLKIALEGDSTNDMALFIRDVKMFEAEPELERVYLFHDTPFKSIAARRITMAATTKKIWIANVRSDGATFLGV